MKDEISALVARELLYMMQEASENQEAPILLWSNVPEHLRDECDALMLIKQSPFEVDWRHSAAFGDQMRFDQV